MINVLDERVRNFLHEYKGSFSVVCTYCGIKAGSSNLLTTMFEHVSLQLRLLMEVGFTWRTYPEEGKDDTIVRESHGHCYKGIVFIDYLVNYYVALWTRFHEELTKNALMRTIQKRYTFY
ncbi:hypothetical protein Trydic_g3349 [Trypoxylus dichotomus]